MLKKLCQLTTYPLMKFFPNIAIKIKYGQFTVSIFSMHETVDWIFGGLMTDNLFNENINKKIRSSIKGMRLTKKFKLIQYKMILKLIVHLYE